MKLVAVLVLTGALLGCAPDRNLLMDTKFDAPLRQKVTALASGEKIEDLAVEGECDEVVNGPMRQSLIDAGADVERMSGAVFMARISSEDIFSLAALDFVTRLHLSETAKPQSK